VFQLGRDLLVRVIAARELDEEQPILDRDAAWVSPGGAVGLELSATAAGARPLDHEPVRVHSLAPSDAEPELLRATEAERFWVPCTHASTWLGNPPQPIRFNQRA
jgi:hypothetical protein